MDKNYLDRKSERRDRYNKKYKGKATKSEYCDEHKISNTQMRFLEYTKINYTFLKEEFDKKHGSISTIHSQE